ncbi:MAG TPA: energy transducer TonB [Pyrinomonadaceae bacterium]|jgi:tetratricopeptide (TPR) repeat protein|nr:energy transducer TonB [Pyrinomonadaceae bacterium]
MRLFRRRLILILGSILLAYHADFSQSSTQNGVRLFEEGKYDAAVQALKKRAGDDAMAAYYLGLSYEKLGQTSEAVGAYKKSFDNGMYLISIDLIKKYRSAPQIKEDILLGKNVPRDEKVKAAYDSLSRLAEIDPDKIKNAEEWENKRLVLEPFMGNPVDDSSPTPLKILSKPFPTYTQEARQNQISGDVRLLIFFLANGKIGPVYPTRELPYGLTENSIDVARRIKFVPATRNGQPITVARIINYNFMLY